MTPAESILLKLIDPEINGDHTWALCQFGRLSVDGECALTAEEDAWLRQQEVATRFTGPFSFTHADPGEHSTIDFPRENQ